MRKFGPAVLLCLAVAGLLLYAGSQGWLSPGLVLKPGTYSAKWVIPEPGDYFFSDFYLTCITCCVLSPLDSTEAKRDFVSGQPACGNLSIGWPEAEINKGGGVSFALDESKGTGKGYDRLYLDMDKNRDLSDDLPIRLSSRRARPGIPAVSFFSVESVPAGTLFPRTKNPNLLALDFYFDTKSRPPAHCHVATRGHWVGGADSNRGRIPFILEDLVPDGVYTEQCRDLDAELLNSGFVDRVISYDRVRFYRPGGAGIRPRDIVGGGGLGSPEFVGGRLYVFRASPLGDKLEIERYTGPTGKIAFEVSKIGGTPVEINNRIQMVAREGILNWHPERHSDQTVWQVPARSYYFLSLYLTAAGSNSCKMVTKPFRVEKGKTTTIRVGGSVRLAIAPDWRDIKLERGKETNIPLKLLLSSGGELRIRTWPRVPRAKVVIKDSAGKPVNSSLVRIWDVDGAYRVVLRQGWKPGNYTIEATFDAGPFGGILKARRPIEVL